MQDIVIKTPTTSPWGAVQHSERFAPGCVAVSTAGHGGLKIADHFNRMLPAAARQAAQHHAGGGWYEEDCAWSVPVYFLAPLIGFSTEKQKLAFETLKAWYPDIAKLSKIAVQTDLNLYVQPASSTMLIAKPPIKQ